LHRLPRWGGGALRCCLPWRQAARLAASPFMRSCRAGCGTRRAFACRTPSPRSRVAAQAQRFSFPSSSPRPRRSFPELIFPFPPGTPHLGRGGSEPKPKQKTASVRGVVRLCSTLAGVAPDYIPHPPKLSLCSRFAPPAAGLRSLRLKPALPFRSVYKRGCSDFLGKNQNSRQQLAPLGRGQKTFAASGRKTFALRVRVASIFLLFFRLIVHPTLICQGCYGFPPGLPFLPLRVPGGLDKRAALDAFAPQMKRRCRS